MDRHRMSLTKEKEDSFLRLERRNRELAALHAISRAVASPSTLTDVLERALQATMDLVRNSGGWICLLGEDNFCRVCVRAGVVSQAEIGLGYCKRCALCQEAARTCLPLVVFPLPSECPLSANAEIVGHATVPLLVKERAVGLLNLVFEDKDRPETPDLDLLTDLGRQLGVAIENARLWAELQDREALRGQLLREIIVAQENERRRIARNLHDQAGQALTSLLVGLRAMEQASSLAQAQALAQDLKGVATQALDEVHDLALELRPSVLDDLGLVPALVRYISSCPTRFGFQADFVTTGMDGQRLPSEVETTLYRIAQETLTNVARHAGASHASILLQRRGKTVVLVVDDDGIGFDVAQAMASPTERERLGLYGIEERASLVSGRLTIESTPGAGTTVAVEIPLESEWLTQETLERAEQTHPSAS